MKYGVVFPQTEIGADVGSVRAYAAAAEELAYDYLLAYDHVVGANPDRPGGWAGRPYDYQSLFHEPLVLFGYLAGMTQRLAFATGILILPQRQTVLVAKQAAQVICSPAGACVWASASAGTRSSTRPSTRTSATAACARPNRSSC